MLYEQPPSRLANFFRFGRADVHSADPAGRPAMSRPWRTVLAAATLATVFLGPMHMAMAARGDVTPMQHQQQTAAPEAKPADEAPPPDLNALPMTQESKYLQTLQKRFGDARPDLPIYYLDSDKMHLERMLLNGRDNPHQGYGPISLQVKAHTGGYLIGEVMNDVRDDLEAHSATSRRIPVGDALKDSKATTETVCMIVPNDPQVTLTEDAGGIMGIYGDDLKGFQAAYGDNPFKLALSRSAMSRWTNYHETAHCLDKYFVEARGDFSGAREYFRRGQGEAYADVVSTFLMAQDGHTGFGYQLGSMRAIGAMRNGPRGANDPDREGWSVYGGAIYYTTPAVYAAQKMIDSMSGKQLRAMTLDQITTLSADIVKTHGLSYAQFTGLFQYHKHGDKYKAALAELARDPAVGKRGPAQNMLDMINAYDGTTATAKASVLGDREPASNVAERRTFEYRDKAIENWGAILKSAYAKGCTFEALAGAIAEFRDEQRRALDLKDPQLDAASFPKQPVLHKPNGAPVAAPLPGPTAPKPGGKLKMG